MKQNTMIHRSARAAIKLLLAALLPATAQTAWAWQGQGTQESPYQISSTEDLDQLATNVNSGTGDAGNYDADAAIGYREKYFVLTKDIDYTHYTDWNYGASTETNYTAIGLPDQGGGAHPFRGHFDGQGHTVSGIRIYKSRYTGADKNQGLFGCTLGAEVKNVTLADARITGHERTGGIVGLKCDGSVINCHVLSNVTIQAVQDQASCHGGIVGYNDFGTVSGCTSAASITTTSITTTAIGCYEFGGIVGYNYGTVRDCLYLGNTVEGDNSVGAIVGNNEGNTAIVQNCYFTSTTITGKDENGGTLANADCAVGSNTGTVAATVALARTVSAGTGVTINAIALTGTATHYDDYHDIITAYSGGGIVYAGKAYCPGGSTVSLTLSTADEAPAGYMFSGYTASAGTLSGSGNSYTLTMPDADVTISAALAVIPWAGTGSVGDPYVISYPSQLDLLAHRVNGTHGETATDYAGRYFKLGADISYTHDTDWDDDASTETNYTAIGCYGHPFQGHFDGKGKTVSGIRIYKSGSTEADWNQGLFGYILGAEVKNVTLADARITGHARTAGIVGWNQGGTITNCHVLSDVTIHAVQVQATCHGGIVGENHSGTVSGCTSAASITSYGYFGGVVGYNYGTSARVSDCLYLGITVEGNKYVGAIVGYNEGDYATIENCYFTSTAITGKDGSGGTIANADCAVGYNDGGTVAATVGLARTVAAGTGVTINAIALTGTATHYDDYHDIITAYSGGGIAYAGNRYYGNGCTVSLTLSTNAPGYVFHGFTASAGTLSGNATDGYTLTMPDADVTISADLTVIPWAGTGSEGDPYVISYPSQLDLLAERVNSGTGDDYAASGYSGKYFQLGDDIAYDPDNLTIDTNDDGTMDSNYKAIGGYYGGKRYFKGHFDGQGHTVSGIRIYWNGVSTSWDSYKGLFGWIDDAVVENVTLADAHITGNECIGGIVGCIGSYESVNPGTVSNCHVLNSVTIDAVVSDAWYHGGIVGYNNGGTVSGCTSAASITTSSSTNSRYCGGIAGTNYGSSARVSDCLYLGTTVEGIKRVGAIVGNNYAGQVQNCYFSNTTFQGKDNNGNNLDNAESAVGYNENGGTVSGCEQANVVNVSYLDENRQTKTRYAIPLTGAESINEDGWVNLGYAAYYVGSDINYTNYISFTRDAILILGDGATMSVGSSTARINDNGFASTNNLTIYGQSLGTGSLSVYTTGDGCSGISADALLTINGGRITADSDGDGAMALYGRDGVTINGGNVSAIASSGVGISGASGITINGGTVTATGIDGISSAGGVTINGGDVTANGDNGISGYDCNVTINGGNVSASGTTYGIYIEDIYNDSNWDITINGGNVTATGTTCGIYANRNLTLGWTNYSDCINASSYGAAGTIAIADGKPFTDTDGNTYSGTLYYDEDPDNHFYDPEAALADLNAALGGKTLYPYIYTLDLAANQAPDQNYWTTFYCGHTDYEIDADENACAYTATYADGKLTLHRLGKAVPKATAVIIVADNNEVSMTAATLNAFTGSNDLRGVDVDTDVADIRNSLGEGTLYVLGMTTVNNEKHFGFHHYTATEMPARKAFVLVPAAPGSNANALTRGISIEFGDDATGVEEVIEVSGVKEVNDDSWYTINGVKLNGKPSKSGLYIYKGRKVAIK